MDANNPAKPRPARWGQFVEILAEVPDVVVRLIVEHVPHADGWRRGVRLRVQLTTGSA
jgi:hypothetical protein